MIFHRLITKLNSFIGGPIGSTYKRLLKCGFVGLLSIHFLILFIHQLPENPIQHQFKYKLHGYVDPFFSQAWTLFAPNPINSNMSLLMRFQYTEDNDIMQTKWIDLTEPLIKDRQENFWSPAQRINKFTQSCMSNVNENHTAILENIAKVDSLKQDTIMAKLHYRRAMETTYGYRSIVQYSKYIAKNYFANNGINAENVSLQYRILNARFPRFSKRKEDYFNLDNYEFTELTSEYIPILTTSI